MHRVLMLSTTTGYQARSFGTIAGTLGIEPVFGTDRCQQLDDPWRDGAIAVRFHAEVDSLAAIRETARVRPLKGVLALGDRPVVLAALATEFLKLPGHPVEAARAASNKLLARDGFARAGLRVPRYRCLELDGPLEAGDIPFPCVVKPLALSGSRGVIRADDVDQLVAATRRVRALLRRPELRALREPAHEQLLIESYIPGIEVSLEAVLEEGVLRVLTLFDKPDPLDGPFFEETIYVTPSRLSSVVQRDVIAAVDAATRALGLYHGPVHAECRVNDEGVWVLEVAARPIGGLCARTLRFEHPAGEVLPLEGLLVRHAIGTPLEGYRREASAAGVMMIPIPRRGRLRGVTGVVRAARVPDIEDVQITAKPDQLLESLPEGGSYLGFIFARSAFPEDVVRALREAHRLLDFRIERSLAG